MPCNSTNNTGRHGKQLRRQPVCRLEADQFGRRKRSKSQVLALPKLNRVKSNAILPIEIWVDVNLCTLGLRFLQIAHAVWKETVFRRMDQEEIARFGWQRRRIL